MIYEKISKAQFFNKFQLNFIQKARLFGAVN